MLDCLVAVATHKTACRNRIPKNPIWNHSVPICVNLQWGYSNAYAHTQISLYAIEHPLRQLQMFLQSVLQLRELHLPNYQKRRREKGLWDSHEWPPLWNKTQPWMAETYWEGDHLQVPLQSLSGGRVASPARVTWSDDMDTHCRTLAECVKTKSGIHLVMLMYLTFIKAYNLSWKCTDTTIHKK